MRKGVLYAMILCLAILFGSTKSVEKQSLKNFSDCEGCPEMVVIPAGSVYIGSHEDEIGRKKGNNPFQKQ